MVQNQTWYGALKLHSELPNKATSTSPPLPAFGSPTVQLAFYCSKCDFVPCAQSCKGPIAKALFV